MGSILLSMSLNCMAAEWAMRPQTRGTIFTLSSRCRRSNSYGHGLNSWNLMNSYSVLAVLGSNTKNLLAIFPLSGFFQTIPDTAIYFHLKN
jgi:ABC-type glycerol-3-phosphate transport system permease component